MFKELRNKFLILNLVIITLVMLASFIIIYFITYQDVRNSINMELRKISEYNMKPLDSMRGPKPSNGNSSTLPDRTVSFSLYVDGTGNLIDKRSIFTMEDDFYKEAMDIVMSKNSDNGKFKLDNNYWAYVKTATIYGYRITYLDITSRQAILIRLIYTFLMVSLVTLIAIYFVSRFFANRSIKPIQEAFNKQTQFIADASHELKTPLAVINTNVDVLLSNGTEIIDSQTKWLNYIKSEVERMSKLTNDLLYLTQIDYSCAKMFYSNFDLSKAVESVLLTMEAVIYENNLNLEYVLEPNIMFNGNSEQLQQVVMILLDNALKYTNENGNIKLDLKKENTNILLTITNTGKGISPENLPKIFDRFYRVDKSRSRESGGYGLGLAIGKAIIEQHGGRISVNSVVDKSTTFKLEFPLK